MNKKELNEAFAPFFTTKNSGTGLGLYVSRKIVIEMGGELEIESTPGEKTELKINLPKNPDQ
jgi:signal transduction histidine kinase